jgi:glutaredoxin
MTIVLDKKMPIKKAKEKIKALQQQKQFDPYLFLGKIKKWGNSGVEYQKMIRNEW